MKYFKHSLILFVLISLMITGCSKSSDDKEAKDKEKGVTISIGMPASHVAISNIKYHQEEFHKQTGHTLDVQAIDDDQFDQLSLTKITSGGMWDLMFMQTGQEASKYRVEENFIDLSNETWVERLKEEERKFLEIDNKVFYFPGGGINSFGIVYNKEVFERLNLEIPKDQKTFEEVANKLKTENITPIIISMADEWTVNQILNAEWPNILAANEGALEKLNKNEISWSELPEFKELFVRMAKWVTNGWVNNDMATTSYEMAQKSLASGEAAMMYMGDWADPEFIKAVPEAEGKLGMFAAPSKDGNSKLAVAGPSGFVISKESKHQEVAKEFLNYLASEDALKYDFEKKNNTSVWRDIENEKISETLKDSVQYIDAGLTETHYNKTYVISPSAEANSAFLSILLGESSPDEAVETWSKNIEITGKQLGVEGF